MDGAAAGIWTRVRGLGGLRRDPLLVSVLDQVAHRVVAVLDHGLVELLVLTHPCPALLAAPRNYLGQS